VTRPAAYPYPPLVSTDPEVLAARMGEHLGRVWDELQAKRNAVLASANQLRKAETLARLDELMQSTQAFQAVVRAEAEAFSRRTIPQVYAQAAMSASAAEPFRWTQFHIDAAQALAADSYGDFLRRSEEASRTSEAFARHVREVARDRTAFAVTAGQTAVQTARDLEKRLAERGITVATYADGSTRSMRVYTEMAVRTKTAVAHNVGTVNRLGEAGIKYVEVFDGAECGWTDHRDGNLANGKIVRLEEALAHPISHPNCRRAFGGRPDITNPKEARSPALSTTPEQRADQAASERASREAVDNARRLRPADPKRDRTQQRRSLRTPDAPPVAPSPSLPAPGPAPAPPVDRPAVQRRQKRTEQPPAVDLTVAPKDRVLPPLPADMQRKLDEMRRARLANPPVHPYQVKLDALNAKVAAAKAARDAQRASTVQLDALPRKSARTLFDDRHLDTVTARSDTGMDVEVPGDLHDDMRRANPGYGTDPQYGNNCVHVVNTVELRRRGWDVESTPLPKHLGTQGRDSDEALGRWNAPEGGERRLIPRTRLQAEKEVDSWPPGARGFAVVRWRKGGGHIFSVEKLADGRVVWFDGQNGKVLSGLEEYGNSLRAKQILLARVDDLTPGDGLLEFTRPAFGSKP
jgi:hypothetical protein